MKYLELRGLDIKVSQLFLGTGWFNTPAQDEIFPLLDAYFASGGNVIDTGRFYAGGDAEGVIARWLAERRMTGSKRDRFAIVNKACHHYVDANNKHYADQKRVKPEFITEDLEYSLDNMKQKYFDVYLLHRDDPEEPVEGLLDRLEKHRKEGKIRVYGVSNWPLKRIAEAAAYAKRAGYLGISVNNPSYSLATVSTPRWFGCLYADDDYIAWHRDKDIFLFAWAPQASGFFAEIFGENPPEDVKKTYFTSDNIEKLARCKTLAAEWQLPPTNVALAYVFSQTIPMAASIGPRNARELRGAIEALEIKLSEDQVNWLSLRKDIRQYG